MFYFGDFIKKGGGKMDEIIIVKGLSKRYGDFIALNNVNINLNKGIYAFLGLNGAGKTTFINLLTDNISRTDGEILYNGTEIKKISEKYREKIGYMPQEQGYYPDFTGREYLSYIAGLKGIRNKKDKVAEVLQQFNMQDKADIKIKKYSGGMRQRIVLAQTMLNEPEIIILDEPTVGLDPLERKRFKSYIKDISKEKIVIYCTHIISDVTDLADKLILMKNGQIVKSCDIKEAADEVSDDKTLEDVVLSYIS